MASSTAFRGLVSPPFSCPRVLSTQPGENTPLANDDGCVFGLAKRCGLSGSAPGCARRSIVAANADLPRRGLLVILVHDVSGLQFDDGVDRFCQVRG